uniref:Uncharacterized protein n=1 Tax=Romanomermis culicivorax TaxID=13658 RepID=A0A915L4U1_ROMCU
MALDFAAGLVGGAAGVLVGHPFDTVKARLQTQHLGGIYKGTLHCFTEIARKESFLGLYKGGLEICIEANFESKNAAKYDKAPCDAARYRLLV